MKSSDGKKQVPIYDNGELKLANMDGIEFVERYIATFPGKDRCYICRKKLGFLSSYNDVYIWLSISYRLCKECYKEYKNKKLF